MKNLKQIIKEEYQKILQEQVQSGFIKTLKIRRVHGGFHCQHNNITSLKGAPSSVDRNFYCYNNNLTSLEGAPSSVGRSFWCDNNKLTSLDGAPRSVGDSFYCRDQKTDIKFDEQDVRKVSDVEGYIMT